MGYEDTNRPNVIIDEPHPGTFVIRGHNPASIDTDEGRIVPLPECYVAPEVPTSALLFILEKRGFEFVNEKSDPVAEAVSGSTSDVASVIPSAAQIESAVIEALNKGGGTLRIAALSHVTGFTVNMIKAVSEEASCAYEVVAAGWVRLKKTEGAE